MIQSELYGNIQKYRIKSLYGNILSFVASKIFPELSNLTLDEIKNNHKEKRQIAKGAGFAINKNCKMLCNMKYFNNFAIN